jgi:CheY-like chemotaxis protein
MPTDRSSVHVAVVDDLRINREGTRAVLQTVSGVVVDPPLDFDQALAREDWRGVDFVLVDVADRSRADTETPGIEVVAHIRECSAGAAPLIIAITGDPAAFEEDVVRRRLLEAGADHFIYREDLDRQLEEVILGASALDPLSAPSEIPELGITRRTRVNELVRFLLNEGAELVGTTKWRRSDERRVAAARAKGEAHARELNPVNAEGALARHGEQFSPSIRQYRRILQRATRLGGSKSKPDRRDRGGA